MPRYHIEHTIDPLETHVLIDEQTGARVTVAPERGGMVTRFTVGDEPVLFLDEATLRDPAKNVRGGIPVLFPIAGPLKDDHFAVGAETFLMTQHGYARNRPWTVTDEISTKQRASIGLELHADEWTRIQYPFEVEIRMVYTLEDGVLLVRRDIVNRDARPAPVQPGLHPYFYVDDTRKGEARVETNATRAWDNVTKRDVHVAAPIDLAAKEVDLHMVDHTLRGPTGLRTRLFRSGRPTIRIDYSDDQDVLVVWTLAARDFVCVEPWIGLANALNEGRALMVPPGERHVSQVSIAVERESPIGNNMMVALRLRP